MFLIWTWTLPGLTIRSPFTKAGVWPLVQEQIIQACRECPKLQICVLLYVGVHSLEKRRDVRNKVRALQVAVRRAGLTNFVACHICDRREVLWSSGPQLWLWTTTLTSPVPI